MKIVYSLPLPADSGHQPLRASALLQALEQRGHEIVFLDAEGDASPRMAARLYQTIVSRWLPTPIGTRLNDTERVAYSRTYSQRVIQMVNNVRPNLIFETYTPFSLAANLASEATGVPYILDAVMPSWEEERLVGTALNAKVLEIHREATREASLLVTVNQATRANLLNEALPDNKLVVIANGVDDHAFHAGVNGTARRRQLALADDTIAIVFVGTFRPHYQVELLVRAFGQLKTSPKTHLLLMGNGETYQATRALVSELGIIERVTFTDEVAYSEVPTYIAAGDIAVLPSFNEFGNPGILYEYMALGRAIVAPDQPAITEILTDGVNTLLFERENTTALADTLQRLIADADLRRQLGQKAAADAIAHSWQKRAEMLEQALESTNVLGGASASLT